MSLLLQISQSVQHRTLPVKHGLSLGRNKPVPLLAAGYLRRSEYAESQEMCVVREKSGGGRELRLQKEELCCQCIMDTS